MSFDLEARSSRDLTRMCEQLAERLAGDGASHPMAATLTLAVRGLQGAAAEPFAASVRVDPEQLARIERGEVSFDQLPEAILTQALRDPRLDVDRLRRHIG
jgi:hypothetical protein